MTEPQNPSVVVMERMLDELRAAKTLYQSGDDAGRGGCLRALHAVMGFLSCFPQIEEEGLVMPFTAITAALFDAEAGVPAPLFKIKRRAGRKADSTIRQTIRGFSALSVDVLITAGMKLDDAAGEVANVLRRCGVTAHGGGGKQITALTVVNWRIRVRADYGKGIGAEIYEEYRDRIAFVDGANETANRAFILNRLEHFVLETRARDEQPPQYAT